MKSVLTLLAFLLCSIGAQAITTSPAWQTDVETSPELSAIADKMQSATAEDFLALTPKQVREMTGEKLGIKGTLALKAAQKAVKKSQSAGRATDIPKGGYIVLVLIGWGFLAMGLMDDFEGNNWWVNLLLSFLCLIPGWIHGFAKMNEYY